MLPISGEFLANFSYNVLQVFRICVFELPGPNLFGCYEFEILGPNLFGFYVYLDPSGSCYLLHGSSILRKSKVFRTSESCYLLRNVQFSLLDRVIY